MGDIGRTCGFGDERLPAAGLVFADAPLPYRVTDTHGVILLANRACGVLLGRLPPELVGVPVTAFAGPPAAGTRSSRASSSCRRC
jgi:PAS domain-containing protein